MNVDQNSSRESANSEPKEPEPKTSSTPVSNPTSDTPSTSRARDTGTLEAQHEPSTNCQSHNTLNESESIVSSNWVQGLFNIFSRANFRNSSRSSNNKTDSGYTIKHDSFHESNVPFKLVSRISVRTTAEQTSLKLDEQPSICPEELAKTVHKTETTEASDLESPVVQQPIPITEQPRSRHVTNAIYVSPIPLRESESNTVLLALGRAVIQEPEPNIPPSYSTVIKFPPPEQRRIFSRIYNDSNLSFSNRVPPPSYAQVQGAWAESLSDVSSEDFLYGPLPQYAECPRCTVIVITETRCTISKLTHFTAVGLCLLGCWPCCLLPYFMESCKDTYHYCPLCQHCFGLYSPW